MGMNTGITDFTLAIVTIDKNMNISGGCPIFYVNDETELQKQAMLVSKCVGGMVHAMNNKTLIIVKH